tara:strand:- start:3573 stop:4247 length:675 start_codon:yes stop_codon:yes gene_type:complete
MPAEIPNIGTKDIRIKTLRINDIRVPEVTTWDRDTSLAIPYAAPVTVDIGTPIVDMPGCVEAHEVDENNMLEDDDPKGTKTFCDAGVPSFNPIDYNKGKLKFERETPVPPVEPPPEKKTPEPEVETPKTPDTSAATAEIECPTQKQLSEEPVGFIFDSGRKVVIGYKLEGTECIRLVEDVPIIQQAINGLPPASDRNHHWGYCCCCYYICSVGKTFCRHTIESN